MDKNRRKFLKVTLIGSGVFLANKVLGPLLARLLDDSVAKVDSAAFKVRENKKILSVYDSSGEEIFQIDKGA